jgi:hypothetical protein
MAPIRVKVVAQLMMSAFVGAGGVNASIAETRNATHPAKLMAPIHHVSWRMFQHHQRLQI